MVELLFSCAMLISVGFMAQEEYAGILDALFMSSPENTLLLDLEYCSSDRNKTISTIRGYCVEHDIDYAAFGLFLMKGLKKVYFESEIDIKNFADKVYAIWSMLPSSIQSVEPFWAMSYADEPLSWGDIEQTKTLYGKMLCFYED